MHAHVSLCQARCQLHKRSWELKLYLATIQYGSFAQNGFSLVPSYRVKMGPHFYERAASLPCFEDLRGAEWQPSTLPYNDH